MLKSIFVLAGPGREFVMANSSWYLSIHSQSSILPDCPLWSYSLFINPLKFINEFPSELCARQFPIPFIFGWQCPEVSHIRFESVQVVRQTQSSLDANWQELYLEHDLLFF